MGRPFAMAKQKDVCGLTPEAPLEEAAPKMILAKFRDMCSHYDGTLKGEDIEALHDMRVASRRLRACMLDLYRCFPAKTHRKLLRRIKRIATSLGQVRDLDVMIDFLVGYQKKLPGRKQAAVEELIVSLQQQREDARTALIQMLDKDKFENLSASFIKFYAGGEGRHGKTVEDQDG